MPKTHYRTYIITTPYGVDENDKTFFVYRIYKANPLTTRESEEHFTDAERALVAAKAHVDTYLVDTPGKVSAIIGAAVAVARNIVNNPEYPKLSQDNPNDSVAQ